MFVEVLEAVGAIAVLLTAMHMATRSCFGPSHPERRRVLIAGTWFVLSAIFVAPNLASAADSHEPASACPVCDASETVIV